MTRLELLNQVAEKLERCEYTPIVTEKEEMQIWAMLLNEVYEEIFNTKRNERDTTGDVREAMGSRQG